MARYRGVEEELQSLVGGNGLSRATESSGRWSGAGLVASKNSSPLEDE